jgi:DNA-binding PadR family transcriptional regulator
MYYLLELCSVADVESEILNKMHERVVKGFLDMVILMELKKRSMNANDVVAFVQNKFYTQIGLGTVHSYLCFLERNDLVKGEWAKKSRIYELTEHGKEKVKAFLNSKDKILGIVLNLFIGA